MANQRKAKPTVRLTHPSGKFTVDVQPGRAKILEERGYVPAAAKPTPVKPAKPAKADED